MEEQHLFDTKHAMHLVRLMRMAKEILSEGKILVKRPDAEELLRIRNGEFDYKWLIAWSEQVDAELDNLYKTSNLQFAADYEAIDQLYREVVLEYWQQHALLK